MRILKHYAIAPEELLVNPEISFTAKGLYAYLMVLRHPEAQTAVGIAMTMREKEDVILSALKELNATGYIDLGENETPVPEKMQWVKKLVSETVYRRQYAKRPGYWPLRHAVKGGIYVVHSLPVSEVGLPEGLETLEGWEISIMHSRLQNEPGWWNAPSQQ